MTFNPRSYSNPLPNIGLYGPSGSGKSSVAKYLQDVFGYTRIHPGGVCREITQRLFGREDKSTLNAVNDALRGIDPDVWIRVSLQDAPIGKPLVIDGVRFQSNLKFLRDGGYELWKVEAQREARLERLQARGQDFDWFIDGAHAGESELDQCDFAEVIRNVGTMSDLHASIKEALSADCR